MEKAEKKPAHNVILERIGLFSCMTQKGENLLGTSFDDLLIQLKMDTLLDVLGRMMIPEEELSEVIERLKGYKEVAEKRKDYQIRALIGRTIILIE